jgi:predicted oxidoreductase
VEYTISVILEHLGVRIETRVAQLGDLLGEEFDTVGGVTENNRLVDLQLLGKVSASLQLLAVHAYRAHLGEKSIETVNLLTLLHKRIVLRDTSQSELLHQVDLVGFSHVAILRGQTVSVTHCDWLIEA